MIELSRTQDEECGDGTTSVIILGVSECDSERLGYNFLITLVSWRNSGPITIPAATRHPPGCYHLRLQQSSQGSS